MDTPAVLPVKLQPSNIRPIAYRIFSKKFGLNVQTEALKVLTETIGLKFGSEWKGPQSQAFLENVAKIWKNQDRGLFIDGPGLKQVLAEVSASSGAKKGVREISLDILQTKELHPITRSDTIVDKEENEIDPASKKNDALKPNSIEWSHYFKIINGDKQPKYQFDKSRKQFNLIKSSGSHLSLSSKVEFFNSRFNLISDRLSRNENFQKPSISSFHYKLNESHQITPVKNLLGRDGQSFLLFGLLAKNETGDYTLEDPTDRIVLDISQAYKAEGSYYTVGMFIVVEGVYSAIGGSIGGKFHVSNMGQPSAERRDISMSTYGNVDFLGLHEEGNNNDKNHIMRIDRQLKRQLQLLEKQHNHKLIFLGVDCFLDNHKTILGLKKFFEKLENEILNGEEPLVIVFSGSFISNPLTATSTSPNAIASSANYKNLFDKLAELLPKFPKLISQVKFTFIPGRNDPWQSTNSLGASSPQMWPQNGIPSVFTSRLARVLPKENFITAWNPTRINYLSQEIAIMRDDINHVLKRNDITFPSEVEDQRAKESLQNDPSDNHISTKVKQARMLVKTILDQGFMQPFKPDLKIIKPYFDYVLRLEPLPSVLVINDATIGPFEVTYNGCKVINAGLLMGSTRRLNYVEYYPSGKKCSFQEIHF